MTDNLRQKSEQILLKVTRLFLFAAIASPLITSIKFFLPYVIPAVIFFQICVTLALICFCLLNIISKSYTPPINKFTTAITLFFVLQGILLFASIEPFRSFIGGPERMGGLWTLLHYYAFFIIATAVFTAKHVKTILAFSLIVSLIVSLRYFIFFSGPQGDTDMNRYALGNPGFLGNYLVFHLFFALWLFLTSKTREIKIALIVYLLLQSAVIFHAGNRASLLGWAVFIGLTGFYFVFRHPKIRIITIGIITVFVLTFTTLIVFKNSQFVKDRYYLWKATNWSLNDTTIQRRFTLWEIALKGIAEKPIFGWGKENIYRVFDKYYNPAIYVISSKEQWIDRAHNVFLDELIAGGTINVIAEIFLFYLLIVLFKRLFRQSEEQKLFAYMGIGFIVSLFVQGAFTLSTMGIYLPLFIVFFATVNMISDHSKLHIHSAIRVIFSIVLFFITTLGAWNFTIIPAIANIYAVRGGLAVPENFSLFTESNKKLDALLPDKDSVKAELLTFEGQYFNAVAIRYYPGDLRILPFQEYIIPKLKTAVQLHPLYLRLKANYATVLSDRARYTRKKEYIAEAISVWDELVKDYPTHPLFLFAAGTIYELSGQHDKAVTFVRQGSAFFPDSGIVHWLEGLAFLQSKNYQEGMDTLRESLKLGLVPDDYHINDMIRVADLIARSEDKHKFEAVRDMYVLAISLRPSNARFHGNLAYIYGQLKEKELAIKEANIAISLSPQHREELEKLIRTFK